MQPFGHGVQIVIEQIGVDDPPKAPPQTSSSGGRTSSPKYASFRPMPVTAARTSTPRALPTTPPGIHGFSNTFGSIRQALRQIETLRRPARHRGPIALTPVHTAPEFVRTSTPGRSSPTPRIPHKSTPDCVNNLARLRHDRLPNTWRTAAHDPSSASHQMATDTGIGRTVEVTVHEPPQRTWISRRRGVSGKRLWLTFGG